MCYRLNICVSPKFMYSHCKPENYGIGDMASGAWLGHKSITLHHRGNSEKTAVCKRRCELSTELNLPALWSWTFQHQNWEKCLLWNHTVYGTLLQQPEPRHQAFLFTGLLSHFGEAHSPESSEEIFRLCISENVFTLPSHFNDTKNDCASSVCK